MMLKKYFNRKTLNKDDVLAAQARIDSYKKPPTTLDKVVDNAKKISSVVQPITDLIRAIRRS